jgi:hypothetical protein
MKRSEEPRNTRATGPRKRRAQGPEQVVLQWEAEHGTLTALELKAAARKQRAAKPR